MIVSIFQFSVFLGIIFFLELTAGVLAFVFKDWIKDQLNFFINNNIRAYRDDIDLQNLIDFTQEYVRNPFDGIAFWFGSAVIFSSGSSRRLISLGYGPWVCFCVSPELAVGVLWRFWS